MKDLRPYFLALDLPRLTRYARKAGVYHVERLRRYSCGATEWLEEPCEP